ncbi:Gfo/Idh/MocA family protein [Geodermatophilus ruber]|uniref:Predicted dehydrogenase n=1 Tax=Geodermatophilus ruber TaxID=504800 RepID=A0A1I3Z9A8_9ACTN|nr:Gfo/Idh/MocA family oxidoreductase [Geodermatophilus ruber]SFK40664.1 Predicted dehydrogenase [Geodermatophilus ruber]
MSAPVRFGIVGTGFMARVHAHAVRAAGGVVTRVAGSSPARAEQFAPLLQAQRPAASVGELVACPDVDVVSVCTPNHLHLPMAERALHAGKHVVCEKPLALTPADAERLTALAAEVGRVHAVPFVYRFYPTVREARERIARGDAGRLWLLHGAYLQDWLAAAAATNWRVDPAQGGASRAFADIGVHWCDLMEFVTGHRITALNASTARAHETRGGEPVATEDGACVLFRTDRGALGSVVVSQVSPGRKNGLTFSFDGTEASYGFDQENPETLRIGGVAEERVVRRDPELLSPAAARYAVLPAGHPQGYQDCFNAFVADVIAAVRGCEVIGLPTFTDGLRAARVTAAVVEAAATGSWVELPA